MKEMISFHVEPFGAKESCAVCLVKEPLMTPASSCSEEYCTELIHGNKCSLEWSSVTGSMTNEIEKTH